jgi:hypothetical protein
VEGPREGVEIMSDLDIFTQSSGAAWSGGEGVPTRDPNIVDVVGSILLLRINSKWRAEGRCGIVSDLGISTRSPGAVWSVFHPPAQDQ